MNDPISFGPYGNGASQVYADPVRVRRKLAAALDGTPDTFLARYHEDDEIRDRVLDAAREALQMVPFCPETGKGATEDVVDAALRSFLEWQEGNASRGSR